MRDNLDDSLTLMFGHEGGYSNRSTDAGGPTKYGITHKTLAAHRGVASVTADQVKAMKLDEAEAIYRKSYWSQSGGDILPAGLDYAAFDFGVNSGPPTAVKALQRVLGFVGKDVDGWIGEDTQKRIATYPGGVPQLIRDYCDERMRYLRSLKKPTGWPANGRGWTIRVTGIDPKGEWAPQPGVVGNALAMIGVGKPVALQPPMPASIADQASAKSDAKDKPNPWTKPEVLLPAGGTVATGAFGALASGLDPIKLAVAVSIMVAVGLGAYFAFQRIRRAEQ